VTQPVSAGCSGLPDAFASREAPAAAGSDVDQPPGMSSDTPERDR